MRPICSQLRLLALDRLQQTAVVLLQGKIDEGGGSAERGGATASARGLGPHPRRYHPAPGNQHIQHRVSSQVWTAGACDRESKPYPQVVRPLRGQYGRLGALSSQKQKVDYPLRRQQCYTRAGTWVLRWAPNGTAADSARCVLG